METIMVGVFTLLGVGLGVFGEWLRGTHAEKQRLKEMARREVVEGLAATRRLLGITEGFIEGYDDTARSLRVVKASAVGGDQPAALQAELTARLQDRADWQTHREIFDRIAITAKTEDTRSASRRLTDRMTAFLDLRILEIEDDLAGRDGSVEITYWDTQTKQAQRGSEPIIQLIWEFHEEVEQAAATLRTAYIQS